jgi:predicted RNase H-like HicB family nuclease
MNKLFYPAIFHVAEEGGFWITFPDFPECMTQGEDMQEAYEMAVDALGLCLTSREQEKQEIPPASDISQISVGRGEYCVIIEFDMLAYKKRTNSKAVKKTLSIPEWLNEEATALGINFSQTLQEALIGKLSGSQQAGLK